MINVNIQLSSIKLVTNTFLMRKIFSRLLIIIISLCLLFTILAVDLSPSVQVSSSEQVDKAESVNALLEQVRLVIRERQASHQISVSPAQAHSLAGFVQRARVEAQADVSFGTDEAVLSMSYHLGKLFSDFYINIQLNLRSGPGVAIDSLTIGSITLPGNWALNIAEYAVNHYTQSQLASRAIDWITGVNISPQQILIDVAPSDILFQELKQLRRGTDDAQALIVKQQVVHYLQLLDDLPTAPESAKASLAYYLSAVISEAARLTPTSDATLENKAALLALAIYAGNYRFSRLVGNLSIAVSDIPTAAVAPVLANREDLSLHFIYSAAIKLLSEQGISIAVGEFKELMDRGAGGSGYSFTDLAADLSGAHFAALAVDPAYAEHLQAQLIKYPVEATFFPDINALDEGLSVKAFSDKYQAVDSPAYQQAVGLINMRIQRLPISVM